jgi:hypothetical protein
MKGNKQKYTVKNLKVSAVKMIIQRGTAFSEVSKILFLLSGFICNSVL